MSYVYCFATQERLVLSILPRFVALEMIADMSSLEDELSPHEFHKIYIHQYKDVRYTSSQETLYLPFTITICMLIATTSVSILLFAASFLQTSRASLCCP